MIKNYILEGLYYYLLSKYLPVVGGVSTFMSFSAVNCSNVLSEYSVRAAHQPALGALTLMSPICHRLFVKDFSLVLASVPHLVCTRENKELN